MSKNMKNAAKTADMDVMKMLKQSGVRSSHAYLLGAVLLAVTVVSSVFMSNESRKSRIGAVLAPTLFTIGLGLKAEE